MIENFGSLDGEEVKRLTIGNSRMTAKILNWGAVVQDLRLEGHAPPLVLGFENFDPYPAQSPYFGAVVGRVANRIGQGRFTLDGKDYALDRNFAGRHTLHGGSISFGRRIWTIADRGEDFVVLKIDSPDGEMGFPGHLQATCTYRIEGPATLVVELEAATDASTICNLTHHGYFNLADGGAGTILDHQLRIDADRFLPLNDDLIPTGEIDTVENSDIDFRVSRPIRYRGEGEQIVHDHNYCLSQERQPLRPVASAFSSMSGIIMDVSTTEPGIQFYAGHKVRPDHPGLEKIGYGPWSGFCLETQIWPDAPNHEHFPSATLRPGQDYLHRTEYAFSQA